VPFDLPQYGMTVTTLLVPLFGLLLLAPSVERADPQEQKLRAYERGIAVATTAGPVAKGAAWKVFEEPKHQRWEDWGAGFRPIIPRRSRLLEYKIYPDYRHSLGWLQVVTSSRRTRNCCWPSPDD